jgi:alkylation response protein AidB-like acyl-CoA dehydrogenase
VALDLTFTEDEEAFRAEARVWLEANVPAQPLASFDTREGFEQHRAWERTLHDAGWAVVSWPVEYGGRGVNLVEWLIFEEEYYRAGAPGRVGQNGLFLLGPTLMDFGTPDQKARFLPRMARADDIWCQGWSEPDAGSDLAGIRSRAQLDGDHYMLSGQKTWCSRGAFADWMFGLFRTDPAAERHRGLTMILVPLDLPGVTVRPIAQLDGETGFAEVFLEDVRVPVDQRLGEEHKGWNVAMATAGFERGVSLRSPGRFMATAARLIDQWRERPDETLRDDVVAGWMDAEAYRLHNYATVSRLMAGGTIGAESSVNKIFWSEMDLHLQSTALRLLGQDAEVDGNRWLDGFLFALSGPIYAGTNEVQRNVIAERVLGLPRSAG